MKQPVKLAGMNWFLREDYDQLMTLFKDRDKLHGTYDEWLAAAETGVRNFERQGLKAIKVVITPDEIQKYCAAKGVDIDAKARTSFANEKLYAMYQRGEIVLG